MNISPVRLQQTFIDLIHIDGIPRNEKHVRDFLCNYMKDFVLTIHEDTAYDAVNGNAGNLIMKVRGNERSAPPVILSAHMDTIKSTKNVQPIVAEGKIVSDGSTILGADNRQGLAIICEVVRSLQENNERYGDIEIVFSICEEIGLLGIKHFDFSQLHGKIAYVLDAGNAPVGTVINKAPSAIRFTIDVMGRPAHAGIAPEKGLNAISLAAKAIAHIKQGRLNAHCTLNIGTIEGGKATNIVPDHVLMRGEIRSYLQDEVELRWNEIQQIFKQEVTMAGGEVAFHSQQDYAYYHIPDEAAVIQYAKTAWKKSLMIESSFGGSDANVFNKNGIDAVVLATGTWEPHTHEEYVNIDEMNQAAQWVYDIVLEAAR